MITDRITIRRWFDRHLHIRDEVMMESVLPCTLMQRATGAIIMPNLMKPNPIAGGPPISNPVDTVEKAVAYRKRIQPILGESDFNPRMTLYLTDHTDPEEVKRGFYENVWCAAKLYMADQNGQGGTTGSHSGVRNLNNLDKVFEVMEIIGMPLLGHFEAVERQTDEFDREIVSIERDLGTILRNFPGLKVVVEHITDGRTADFVAESSHKSLHSTVTAHHLMLNRNDLFWDGMTPNHWCKPVLKREEHRLRIREYVTSGHPRFGAGTDSAPHDKANKEKCCGCAAGIFTAPCAVELYTTVFDEDGKLENLEAFLSTNFIDLYGMEVSEEMMTLERSPLLIPKMIGNVHVFKGGEELQWKLV